MNDSDKKTSFQSSLLGRRDILKAGSIGLAATVVAPFLLSSGTTFAAQTTGMGRILTVFHSRSGNTKVLASIIHAQLGGDIAEIRPATPYSDDYDTATVEARHQLITGQRPTNQPLSVDVASYDVIFVGSPLWWGTLSVPTITFLTQYDLAGKTIIPFSTNGGGSRDKTFDDVRMICASSKVLSGFKTKGSSVSRDHLKVKSWLRDLTI